MRVAFLDEQRMLCRPTEELVATDLRRLAWRQVGLGEDSHAVDTGRTPVGVLNASVVPQRLLPENAVGDGEAENPRP